MNVFKFGGTSVGSPENIKLIKDILARALLSERLVVVVSAFGGVTDLLVEGGNLAQRGNADYEKVYKDIETRHLDAVRSLLDIKRQGSVLAKVKILLNELSDILHGVCLVKELTPKTLDFILSFGERLSAFIICEYLNENRISAEYADSSKLIKTDKHFGQALIDQELSFKLINNCYKRTEALLIFPGFFGSTSDGEITTFGRGGSDLTASIVAAALGASELQIWTDVDGVMTIDPKKVKKAFPVKRLSYAEAMELSHFGAKVIYPPTIQPVLSKNIPIHIKNTFNPESQGTLISKVSDGGDTVIKGISSIDNVALLTLQGSGMIGITGTSKRLFSVLADNKINVILISQASSEHSISFAVAPVDAERAKFAVENEFLLELQAGLIEGVTIEDELSIVAVVGENMKKTHGIAGKLFSTLGRNGVNVVAIAQGSSELNISFVINNRDLRKSLNVIHDSFFLSETRDVNLFLVGVGTIGKTLLKQIKAQHDLLAEEHGINVRIVGLANSKKMYFDEGGIDISDVAKTFSAASEKSGIYQFVDSMINMNLPNSVFVDCTASEEISACYKKVLSGSISIVTPNKIACSSAYADYKELKDIAFKKGIKFLFETNVGAGLPIIGTIADLIKSGDRVHHIEAILSGTLNFVFNTYREMPLSKVVKAAQEGGYSEPDPRLDLNGSDVGRKILILAREIGKNLEPEDVEIVPFLSDKCMNASSLEAFYEELEKVDDEFEKQRASLQENGIRLRFVAKYENGKASAQLMECNQDHPFYGIEGKDNIVLLYTDRYNEQPLIIKGAGAGAEVTAAGVFADIIRIGNL